MSSVLRSADPHCIDCLDQEPVAAHGGPAAGRQVAFWLLAFVFAATMLGTTLPTPLYPFYQAQWHFSSAIVTVIFAVYAAGVLAALLLAGRSSDQAGRKPVLAVALGLSVLSTVGFILAPDVAVLLVARVLSGVSAGLMTGTATAALTELAPAAARRRASLVATATNMGGLGLGPLVAGLFAQYVPQPTVAVFEAYLVLLAIAALSLRYIPETISPRRRPSFRLVRLAIPDQGRGEFLAAAVAAFSAFSLLGLFSALAPTFLGSVLHEHRPAVQGTVVFLIFAVGTVTQLAAARLPSRRAMVSGLAVLLVALALIATALSQATLALFLVGAVVAGVGVGGVFLGSLATANRLAPPDRRGQTIATYFAGCYCGLIVPVIGVGVASVFIGDFSAIVAFSVLIAALCLLALAGIQGTRGGLARRQSQ
jgi:MFS family permease